MGRPKLQEKDKKAKLGITISRKLNQFLEEETSNKSRFIEELIKKYFDEKE